MIAHNISAVSSGAGPTEAGKWAVGIGLALSLVYAVAMTTGRRPAA